MPEPRHGRDRDGAPVDPYPDNAAYLAAELDKLDALLGLRLAAFRQLPRARLEVAGQSLYISHQEVDRLLRETPDASRAEIAAESLRQRHEALTEEVRRRSSASLRAGVSLGLPGLCRLFGLSVLEAGVILVCLAPELRRKYDTLYAYLQDDITRRRPSVDLALALICPSEAGRWRARALFAPTAPLLRFGLLQPVEDPASPSGSSDLARFLQLDPRILCFLLGHPTLDSRLLDLVEQQRPLRGREGLPREPEADAEEELEKPLADTLVSLVDSCFSSGTAPPRRMVIHFHGPRGVGKRQLARTVCAGLGCQLLELDAGRLLAREGDSETLWRLALRDSVLLEAPLFLAGADVLLRDEARLAAVVRGMEQALSDIGWLLFLAGEEPWAQSGPFKDGVFHSLRLDIPPVPARQRVWRQALEATDAGTLPSGAASLLAERFRLTPGQIRDAAVAAERQKELDGGGPLELRDLAAACRECSTRKLAELALQIRPRYSWTDLVLPSEKKVQLEELGAQVKHRYRVYGEWGFGDKLARGRAVSALFSGPPGTGKTMAAEVLAHDLELDLYKIDLARVVSKYIGETEKNLARIFAEADRCNVILFFDEADALFGKRTEIADAHDRYANIETSYLLQKMEEHDGVVILASNLRENMDDAFLRRIRHVVELPFPDAASRLEIWRTHFPDVAPVAADVDFRLLAERLRIAGGHIKNVSVNAAFYAADDGGVIAMEHILRGARREFAKIGKLWDTKSWPAAQSPPGRR